MVLTLRYFARLMGGGFKKALRKGIEEAGFRSLNPGNGVYAAPGGLDS
jgi:hypothetical protein